uniref:Uncharacterized protein n=1 Tax=Schistocephalus solidus TaxID=70667 RepID=A0A0V0J182_SCHSO
MFRQPSKSTIKRHVARDVAEICREVTEEVERYILKRKRVKINEECTSAPSSYQNCMDVPLETDESSLWSSAVEPTDDSEEYSDSSSEEEESSTESCTSSQTSIRDRVREWAIESNIAHSHLRTVLEIFKSLVPDMPTDPRTLLRASYSFTVVTMGSGEYVHIGLGSQLKRLLENRCILEGENEIVVNLAIDGLPVYRKTKLEFWPILAMVIRPFISAVFPVAIYCGNGKPNDVVAFCKQTVDEINELQFNGISLGSSDKSVIVRVAAVICDAPARSFVKQISSNRKQTHWTKQSLQQKLCLPGLLNAQARHNP